MKRNVALLLAGVVATSAVPVNVNATALTKNNNADNADNTVNTYDNLTPRTSGKHGESIEVTLAGSPLAVQENTFLADRTLVKNGQTAADVNDNEDIEQWVKGIDVQIDLKNNFGEDSSINDTNNNGNDNNNGNNNNGNTRQSANYSEELRPLLDAVTEIEEAKVNLNNLAKYNLKNDLDKSGEIATILKNAVNKLVDDNGVIGRAQMSINNIPTQQNFNTSVNNLITSLQNNGTLGSDDYNLITNLQSNINEWPDNVNTIFGNDITTIQSYIDGNGNITSDGLADSGVAIESGYSNRKGNFTKVEAALFTLIANLNEYLNENNRWLKDKSTNDGNGNSAIDKKATLDLTNKIALAYDQIANLNTNNTNNNSTNNTNNNNGNRTSTYSVTQNGVAYMDFLLSLNHAEWMYQGFTTGGTTLFSMREKANSNNNIYYYRGANTAIGAPDVIEPGKVADLVRDLLFNYIETGATSGTITMTRDVYIDLNQGYIIVFNNSNKSESLLYVLDKNPLTGKNYKDVDVDRRIFIPLVVRTLSDMDSSIYLRNLTGDYAIEYNSTKITNGSEEGETTTIVDDPPTARTNFLIKDITVRENRIAAFPKNGSFEIVAPSGYEFDIADARFFAESGVSIPGESNGTDWVLQYRNNNDQSVIVIAYKNLVQSTATLGTLGIKNLRLVENNRNVDTIVEKDLYMNIRNVNWRPNTTEWANTHTNNQTTVRSQRFLAAYARNWRVKLTTLETIPTLVSGRLEGEYSIDNNDRIISDNIGDTEHKAATIKFEEQVENAWWAQRVTTFTLPEEVRIRKAEFRRTRYINNGNDLETRSFYNGDRSSYVRIDDNVLTLSDLNNNTKNKAKFELDLWLSIQADYSGDIPLRIGGSAVTTEGDIEQSIVIARAINPVTITADLSNVKVGYQHFTVGDFTIRETAPGVLKYNKEVYVSVVDNISSDISIMPGFNWEITEGDMKVRNMSTSNDLGLGSRNGSGDGQIKFKIDRESSRASAIRFSNVKVKVSGAAPITNSSSAGYDIVAWGPAVANNYEGLIDYTVNGRDVNRDDYFNIPGISTKYLSVLPDVNNNSTINNVVKVTVGNPVIVVNGKQVTMPVAAYISQRSNSTMVPVRFISTALGIPDDSVIWDAKTGTITIDSGERIVQMQTNSDTMVVNGVDIPMLSPDGLRVTVEITDDRAFIPFRTLGEAFGINVGWDATSATATYNAANADLYDNNDVDNKRHNNSTSTNNNNYTNSYSSSYNLGSNRGYYDTGNHNNYHNDFNSYNNSVNSNEIGNRGSYNRHGTGYSDYYGDRLNRTTNGYNGGYYNSYNGGYNNYNNGYSNYSTGLNTTGTGSNTTNTNATTNDNASDYTDRLHINNTDTVLNTSKESTMTNTTTNGTTDRGTDRGTDTISSRMLDNTTTANTAITTDDTTASVDNPKSTTGNTTDPTSTMNSTTTGNTTDND